MGASREMTIAAFLEPALVVAFAAFALASGSATVDGMLSVAGAGLVARPWLLPAVAALGLVALGRCADLAAALEALSPPLEARPLEIPEVASPAEIALYKGLRASVPGLLAAYDEVARLFT